VSGSRRPEDILSRRDRRLCSTAQRPQRVWRWRRSHSPFRPFVVYRWLVRVTGGTAPSHCRIEGSAAPRLRDGQPHSGPLRAARRLSSALSTRTQQVRRIAGGR